MMARAPTSQPLTPAEERAVALLAQGMTYRQVAGALGISLRTAKSHIKNAGDKIPGKLPLKARVIEWYHGVKP